MALAKGENPYIYGIHDPGGKHLVIHNREGRGWVVVTEEIGANRWNHNGSYHDYRAIVQAGLGLIVRLNHAYGPRGTIPREEYYANFAARAANFVRQSPEAHIWIVGNEPNLEREQPRQQGNGESGPAEVITPRRYANCYLQVRRAIRQVPGHNQDLVIVSAIGPWNAETHYEADSFGKYPANKIAGATHKYPYHGYYGDYTHYLRDMLQAIGASQCDGIAIHAYSHGYDPNLVFSDAKMGPPYEKYFSHFRTYRDQMAAIPAQFRHLPVYLTEMNGDKNWDKSTWPNVNSGWIRNAYTEIDHWNQQAGHQQVRCAVVYRWVEHDEWSIKNKYQVQRDLKQAVAQGYRWKPAKSTPGPLLKPKKLAVPYVSQLAAGAEAYNQDSGAACGCMVIQAYTRTFISPDDFFRRTGQIGDRYLTFGHLSSVLVAEGINVRRLYRLSLTDVFAAIKIGRPLIVTFNYGALRERVPTHNQDYDGAHYGVIVGHDHENIYLHDPFWPQKQGETLAISQSDWYDIWTAAEKDGNIPRAALIPTMSIDNLLSLKPLYRVEVTSKAGLRVRNQPVVSQTTDTGHRRRYQDTLKIWAESRENGNEWGAITADKHRWIALTYKGATLAKRTTPLYQVEVVSQDGIRIRTRPEVTGETYSGRAIGNGHKLEIWQEYQANGDLWGALSDDWSEWIALRYDGTELAKQIS